MVNQTIIKFGIFLHFLRLIFSVDSDPYKQLVIDPKNYSKFCTEGNKFKCFHGMSACFSKGYLQLEDTYGGCKKPDAYECIDLQIEKCEENSLCILEYKFVSNPSSKNICAYPEKKDLNCLEKCDEENFEICSGQGYYIDENQICKKMENPRIECDGKDFCQDSHDFKLCKVHGYEINNDNDGKCGKIEDSECLNQDSLYCQGPESYCVKVLGFEYDKKTNSCDINCLEGYKCKDESSLCISTGKYNRLNDQGRCYVKKTLSECLAEDICPMACYKGYNLSVYLFQCQFPSHTFCDQVLENSIYGCSQDKQICKYSGWIQNEKGSNKCKQPTNCIGQSDKCQQIDQNKVSLGNYLGLIDKNDGNGFKYPTIDDCNNKDLCQRAESECRRFGYINSYSQLAMNSCKIPTFDQCYMSKLCSAKIQTMCSKLFGFVAIEGGSLCVPPTNCSELKKGDFERHSCELIGYESVDKNYNFILLADLFSVFNLSLNTNYNFIYDVCVKYISFASSTFCSSEESPCKKIGFLPDQTGKCIYPQPEDCLKAGGQKCNNNGICLRKFNYKQSTNNDCILPFDGDYKKCSSQNDYPQNLQNYCKSYFGQKQYSNIQSYCSDKNTKRCADQNSYCVKYIGYNVAGQNPCSTSQINIVTFSLFNNYGSVYYSKGTSPLAQYTTCFSKQACTPSKQGVKTFCQNIGFINNDKQVCDVPKDCNLDSYNHACHLTRQINPSDIAAKCIDQPNCSQYCIYIGFDIDKNNNNTCKLPSQEDCDIISLTTDIYYHACSFRNYGTDSQNISFYCLEKGKNRCSQDSICVKYYKFETSQNSDCILPNYNRCLPSSPNSSTQNISISCKSHFSFILNPLKQFYTQSSTQNDIDFQNSKSLFIEFRYIPFKTSAVQPNPLQCLNKSLKLCQKVTRFKNELQVDTNYLTPCQMFGFQSAADGSCFVDNNICVNQSTNCNTNLACQTNGFTANPDDKTNKCYILDQDKFYCDSSRKYHERLDLCESKGYKWVTDHYELPTHQECEDSKNTYCSKGKTVCTSRGWTAGESGICTYTINCLETKKYNCLSDDFICSYIGYVLKPDQPSDIFDCIAPTDQICTEKGKNHCQSKTFSLCSLQGYTQDSNNDCKCETIVYQGKCIQTKTNDTKGNKSNATMAYMLFFNIYILLILLLLINI